MKVQVLERKLLLDHPIDDVFRFFADAGNLEELTPPWLKFRIKTELPITMRVGCEIEYRLRVHGFPVNWRSLISEWNPPHSFVDEQVMGPYRLWHHQHLFEETAQGTLVRDIVRYVSPGGVLVHKFLVGPDLDKIFAFRHQQLTRRFSSPRPTNKL